MRCKSAAKWSNAAYPGGRSEFTSRAKHQESWKKSGSIFAVGWSVVVAAPCLVWPWWSLTADYSTMPNNSPGGLYSFFFSRLKKKTKTKKHKVG